MLPAPRDAPLFWRHLLQNLALCGATAALEASVRFCASSLALDWREALTRRLQRAYFANMNYYTLSHVDRRVENPDQRLVEDIPKVMGMGCVGGRSDWLIFRAPQSPPTTNRSGDTG